eukprot:1187405-Prymnesium_polylepis.1
MLRWKRARALRSQIIAEASKPSKVAAKLRSETFTALGDVANRSEEGGIEARKITGSDGRFYRGGY